MPAWKDYQEAVADNFRRLGLMTETDVRLEGARGRHDIDVVVRGTRVGIEFLWVIECKLWNRNVSKQAVATLSTVVQDIGADRGILLTNKGFQAGASMLATRNNITLLSTDELVAASEVEVHQHQCVLLRNRCDAVIFEVDRSGFRDRNGNQRFEPGWESMAFDTRVSVLKTAIDSALRGTWPVPVLRYAGDVLATARSENMADLIMLVDFTLSEIEAEFAAALGHSYPQRL